MKLLSKLFHITLCYKIFDFIRCTYYYIRDYEYVSESFYSDAFEMILRRYLNLNVKKDWLGRLYGIINPNLDINGKVNLSNIVVELDGNNTNSNEYVKHWIMGQMSMVQNVFNLQNSGFFDDITVDIKHVGPKNHDNFLVVFDLAARYDFADSFKKMMVQMMIYALIIGILFILL